MDESAPTSEPGGKRQHPLLLFDGVCNLCNAAIQWVIERDDQRRFRFASLQSEVARRELARAGSDAVIDSLPDSIVLIDEDGIHTRSSAALRVARRLGFPYSLAAAGILLPRPLRDAVYSLIARNRYRWFGRRDTCMLPGADLADRFLDAQEPRPHVAERDTPAGEEKRRPSWVSAWLPRLAIAYVIVYMAPFPLTLLSYLVANMIRCYTTVQHQTQQKSSTGGTKGTFLQVLNALDQFLCHVLGIAVTHAGVVFKEQQVFNAGKASTLAALDHEHVLCIVGIENRHAVNGTGGVFSRRGVETTRWCLRITRNRGANLRRRLDSVESLAL